jgi:hypothetical protein
MSASVVASKVPFVAMFMGGASIMYGCFSVGWDLSANDNHRLGFARGFEIANIVATPFVPLEHRSEWTKRREDSFKKLISHSDN